MLGTYIVETKISYYPFQHSIAKCQFKHRLYTRGFCGFFQANVGTGQRKYFLVERHFFLYCSNEEEKSFHARSSSLILHLLQPWNTFCLSTLWWVNIENVIETKARTRWCWQHDCYGYLFYTFFSFLLSFPLIPIKILHRMSSNLIVCDRLLIWLILPDWLEV